ncbi:hypothetical protein LPB03_13030 [Polaribacter vadi]|uniref:Secretion system C-terminal sorting domain-containing protein n=1 Tax=Polaribacter vadi TaxID=1774273 RepID=A0A1B8TTU4_9FLAO|nr:FG-GAP-like repeat-containing protein [Polaribacter vadi]AOW18317.1 hypothetical protein LPB03_13030 [Polaribacter vadi]OBY63050.1 hypothetical protein LPB3_13045 [Polaribacter vadi]
MKLKLLFILSIIIGLNGIVQTSSAQISAESFKFTQLTNSSTQGVFAKGATIYIGTTSGLLISTDSGTTFTTKTITNGLGSNNVKNVFVDGSTIYAATDGGLSVSTNGGNNFVNYAPASFAYGNNMNDVFADGDTIYALASNRLWISNDAGATFIEKSESDGIGESIFREIVANGSDVYVATDGGLSISSDGGNTFINKTNTDGLANVGANGVSFSNGVLYAASEGFDPVGGLSISTDKGNTFTVVQQSDGLAANSVNTVYSEGVNVFVGVSSSVISVSNDSGATFTRYDYDDGILGVVNQIFFDSGKIYVSTNVGVFFGEEAFPEIDVKGNNVSIVNGDTTPSATDNTDFGVSVNTVTKFFTIDNSEGFADLSLTTPYPNYVTISGSTDFTISTQPNANSVTKGSSKTFQVTYTPNLSGNQTAIISIANNDSDENPYTFTISGNKGVFSNYTTTFEPQTLNPNGLTSIGIFSNANFADLDNDGDLDLLSGGRGTSFYYFENTGSNLAPIYAAVQNNPFGLTNLTGGSDDSFPTFVDLDNDGDIDIFSGDGRGNFFYFENTGTSSAPQYGTPVESPFGIVDISASTSYPTFGDIDNDGDLDLLAGSTRNSGGSPNFYYYENSGTATSPQFSTGQTSPFGLNISVPLVRPNFGDLDADGDLDLIAGVQGGEFLYFENIGTAQNPRYAVSISNPFGFSGMNGFSTPAFIDYDFDGDLDIMTGGSGGNFRYYQNGPSPSYTQIPDINFEKRLIALGYDSEGIEDGRALTSDLEVVTQFAGTGLGILDFTGLEAFRDLEVLNIYNNLITSIDLSNNLKLKELYISNQTVTEGQVLTSLDVSNNVLLEKLEATNNQLTVLDISNNPLLTVVDVSENELTSLDVSNQPNLLELDFATNQLTSIDVTNNTALTKLQGNDNDLTGAVDVSQNVALLNLSINNNVNLGNMNVVANVNLVRLNLSTTGSTMVDVSSNTALEEFFVASNNFTSLDVSQNVALKQIGVAFNQLTELDLSANSALTLIRAENNSLTSFNIQNGNNANVIQFDVRNNPALECILVDDVNSVSNLVNKDVTASFSSTVCFSASDYTQIPDINFEKRLIALGYDSEGMEDGRALTSDLEVVTQFAGTGLGIIDFTGLEAFRDLEVLNIYNNLITSIDLSNNLKLKELYISNQTVTEGQVLTSLDISSNVLLEKLVATNNQLTVLDVSNNLLLTVIDVSENELTSLDVSNQPNLLELDFATNQLTAIDVTNNTALTKLQGNNNDLTGAVDVSQNVALLNLSINNNANLGNMNVAANVNLVRLNLSTTGSTSVNVSSNTALEEFFVASNNFTSLDVSQNVALKQIGVAFNQITDLDLSTNSALTLIRAENNSLTSFNIQNGNNANVIQFDVRNNPALGCVLVDDVAFAQTNFTNKDIATNYSLDCSPIGVTLIPDVNFEQALIDQNIDSDGVINGQVLTVEIENIQELIIGDLAIVSLKGIQDFAALQTLDCRGNEIENLDLSNNTALISVIARNNKLVSVDVSNSTNLEELSVQMNFITSLDVSSNINLTELNCEVNEINSLDVLSNTQLVELNCGANNLTVLNVSNNTLLKTLTVDNNDLTTLNVTLNKDLEILGLGTNTISSLDISNQPLLKNLNISNSEFTTIDVSNNPLLEIVSVQFNQLTNLDVTNNVKLKTLRVNNNNLTGVDISQNLELIEFDAKFNSLINVDIANNTKLTRLFLNDNNIERAALKNGANNLITTFDIKNNPDLSCISVDDISFANTNWVNKDASANYNTDCSAEWSVYTTDTNFNSAVVAVPGVDDDGDGKVTYAEAQAFTGDLNFSGQNIAEITGLEAFTNAGSIDISNNVISSITVFLSSSSVVLVSKSTKQTKSLARAKNKVRKLNVSDNLITDIDISKLTDITELDARNNRLTSLNLKNANNAILDKLDVTGNSNLSCIEVDNVADALAKADWKKDVTATYNVSCKALSTEDFLKENVAAYPNPASSFVEILLSNGLELKKVEIFNATGKKLTTAKDTLLNVEELSAGIYFIKITTDKGAINKRIIKN